jgi:hypothetical protein
MKFFVKAVINGFAFSLGVALFKKVAKHVGLGDEPKPAEETSSHPVGGEGASDSNLQHRYS